MSAEENKAIVRRYWEEVWNQKHRDMLDESLRPSIPFICPEGKHIARQAFRHGSIKP